MYGKYLSCQTRISIFLSDFDILFVLFVKSILSLSSKSVYNKFSQNNLTTYQYYPKSLDHFTLVLYYYISSPLPHFLFKVAENHATIPQKTKPAPTLPGYDSREGGGGFVLWSHRWVSGQSRQPHRQQWLGPPRPHSRPGNPCAH